MPFQYVSVEDAIGRAGLRMVVVGDVPSPWGEAAKGIFHIKGLTWVAVRLAYDSDALKDWAGQRSGPVAIYDNERPRSGWAEILLLAERLAPAPSLLPADAAERALVFGLAHEICGEARPGLVAPLAAGARRPAQRGRILRARGQVPGQEIRLQPRGGRGRRRAGGAAAAHAGARG